MRFVGGGGIRAMSAFSAFRISALEVVGEAMAVRVLDRSGVVGVDGGDMGGDEAGRQAGVCR